MGKRSDVCRPARGKKVPNGVTCGPEWSTIESSYTSIADFCAALTGSSQFEVYYTCTSDGSSAPRAVFYGTSWEDDVPDNGYVETLRCYF